MQQVTPIHFFQTLFGEPVGPGRLMLWTHSSRGTTAYTYWPNNLDEAARKVCKHRKSRDVYFGVALQNRDRALEIARRRRPRVTERLVRASEDSVTLLPALWADLSFTGPGHSQNGLPPNREAILSLLSAVPRPPSIVVHTGDGLQVYWLLREPLVLATPEARLAARRLLEKLQAALRAAAAERGWWIAWSANPAHLLRVPGTLNHKFSPAVPVTLEHFPLGLGTGDWAYRPEDFNRLPEPDVGVDVEALMRDPGARRDVGPAANFQLVFDGCPFLQYGYAGRASLPEEEWEAALEVIVGCRIGDADGRRLGHRYSRNHPGHTVDGTDAKIDQALSARGPRTCEGIGGLSAETAACCAGCLHKGQIEDPTELGRDGAPLARGRKASRATAPKIGAIGAADTTPRNLVFGLEELLETLGGVATSRGILEQLATHRGHRYTTLRLALAKLFPNLHAEALPTPAQLSVKLGSMRDRLVGGACIEQKPRNHKGLRWSIRRVKEASP